MKKKLCNIVFFLLLLGTGGFAQSSVAVTPITANYAATPPTVTFEVSWPAGSRSATHLSKVWVLVDYRRIQNNAYVGGWLRAGIAGLPTYYSAGTPTLESGNTKGFWLQGTDGAFAATVTVPVTVDLSGYASQFGWCGVASDRPPFAEEKNTYYALNGSPDFIIQTVSGNAGSTVSQTSSTYNDCIYGLSDATGAPGNVPAMPAISDFTASAASICAGQSVTLTATATNAQSYSFDDGANWQSTDTKTVSPLITTTYKLKATREKGGCTVTFPTQITITVRPTPELEFVSPPAGLCANSEAVLTVNDKNNAASSYCFTYECTDCVHNPYLTGNDETAAAACHWYSECVYGEANTYTVYMYDAGTLTVWAKAITEYGCVDSTSIVLPKNDPPAITLLSGSNDQTVTAGTAITEIKYTTANASGAIATGLPDGVSGTWSSNVYTISGTPTSSGTFDYTATTDIGNGCTNASATGRITVQFAYTYTYCNTSTFILGTVGFANTTTYQQNGITISAPVTATNCNKTNYSSGLGPYIADCRTNPSYDGDLFSWCMVVMNASKLCPSPWHVPTIDEYCAYSGQSPGCSSSVSTIYAGVDGWLLGGACYSYGGLYNQGDAGIYWAWPELHGDDAWVAYALPDAFGISYSKKHAGYSLRCVK